MGTGGSGSDEASQFHTSIATGRLRLRPVRPADEPALGAMAAAVAVAANRCATIAPEGDLPLAIVATATGDLVGGANCGPSGLGTGVEIALWIAEPWWGRGYGTEAAQGLIDHAFRAATVDVVWCLNRVTNPRGRRVVERCGFQFRGTGMVRLPGRGAFPIERFALDRRSWASIKAWGAGNTAEHGRAARETAA